METKIVQHSKWRNCLIDSRLPVFENRLVNLGTDIETNNVLDARFKKLVSGEPQIAEMKHGDPFEFRPYAKLLFSAN